MATYHSGIITGIEAEKLYSYPTLPAAGTSDTSLYLAGNGTWATVSDDFEHPTISAELVDVTYDNVTVGFGDAVTISQASFDSLGHIDGFTDWTLTMPDDIATTTEAGLMSAADKIALDNVTSLTALVDSLAGLLSETLTGSLDADGNLLFTRSNGSTPIKIELAGFY